MKVDRTAFLSLTSLFAAGAAVASTMAGCTVTSITNNPDASTNIVDGSVSDASHDGGACLAADPDLVFPDTDGGTTDAGTTTDAGSTSDAGTVVAPTCEGVDGLLSGPCAQSAEGMTACLVAQDEGSPAVFAQVLSRLKAKTGTCTEVEATAIVEGVVGLACPNVTLEAKCNAVATSMACTGVTVSASQIATCKRAIVAANAVARDRFEDCAVGSVTTCPFSEGGEACLPLLAAAE